MRTALLGLAALFALGTGTASPQRPTDLVGMRVMAKVIGVTDGDTVDVDLGQGRRVRVRLEGVDTPERREPFSQQARTFTRVLMLDRDVQLTGKDVDRYGRLVGRISVDGTDASEALIGAGLACTFRQYASDPVLEAALREARSRRSDFWAPGAALPGCVAREARGRTRRMNRPWRSPRPGTSGSRPASDQGNAVHTASPGPQHRVAPGAAGRHTAAAHHDAAVEARTGFHHHPIPQHRIGHLG